MTLENCAIFRSATAMEHGYLQYVNDDAPIPVVKQTKHIGHLIGLMSQSMLAANPAFPSNTDIMRDIDVSQMPHLLTI